MKLILEKRIEELNQQRQVLHTKLIAYEADEEMKAIAEEYFELQIRRDTLNRDIAKF